MISSKLMLALCLVFIADSAIASTRSPEDCTETSLGPNRIALMCHLSAINSKEERTNFSVIPSSTVSLSIHCTERSTKSALEPMGFANLANLEHLVIDNCDLGEIPENAFANLEQLRRLVLSAPNEVVLSDQALSGLIGLEEVQMSGLKMRNLPRKICQQLPKLKVLNVSDNSLENVDVLGNCENLQIFDISDNELIQVNRILSIENLQEAHLAGNKITAVGNVKDNLKMLDLSHNELTNFPRFEANSSLLTLKLSNNRIVASKLSFLEDLETLDLSHNNIDDLKEDLLSDLRSLKRLDLSHNSLITLPSSLLINNEELEDLSLEQNHLESLPASLLTSSTSLQSLSLSDNRLSTISPTFFATSRTLKQLHLSHNQLSTLDLDLFKNCSDLSVLDLSSNRFESIPRALQELEQLQTLDLSYNSINGLDSNSALAQMKHLWRLQLSHNKLNNLSQLFMERLEALQVLDLSHNSLKSLQKELFAKNKVLQALRLDGNLISEFAQVFRQLEQLRWLNMSDNRIVDFDYKSLPKRLVWLDLSHNRIENLSNDEDVISDDFLNELDVLDIGFNRIKRLTPNNVPDSVQTLLANDNELESIGAYTFFKKRRLIKVDLTVNNLRRIDSNALRIANDIKPILLLGGNPVQCDCHMEWLKHINNENDNKREYSDFNYPLVEDLESLYCRLLSGVSKTFVPLVEAASSDFVCNYESHCFALCNCCDFDACDCEMRCPNQCECYHDALWTKNVAVCSSASLQNLPEQLPMDATEIYLDGNQFEELDSHMFIGRKRLQHLHLNNSHIRSIENQTFNGLSALKTLHLEGNELSVLNGFEFEALINLRELYLHDNLIEFIHKATFRALRSLQILHLHNNRLVDFPVWQLALNPRMNTLRLADNRWSCDCAFMERFSSWMSVYNHRVFDAETIECIDDEENKNNVLVADFDVGLCGDLVYEYNDVDVVALRNTVVQERRHEDQHNKDSNEDQLIIIMAIVLVSLAIILLLLCALFVYRHSLRVWIHSKYGVRVFDNSFDDLASSTSSVGDAAKLFDLFVLYSPRDANSVQQTLLKEVQHSRKPPLKTLLLHRDLVGHAPQYSVATPPSASSVCRASESSRRTLLVLSQHFLATEWTRPDIRSGLQMALRSQRNRKLTLIVIMGPLETKNLDPDLRLIIKNCGLVLNWGDAKFWEKLNYALPDNPVPSVDHLNEHSISPNINAGHYEEHIYHQPRYVSAQNTMMRQEMGQNLLLNNMLLGSVKANVMPYHGDSVYNVLESKGSKNVVMHI